MTQLEKSVNCEIDTIAISVNRSHVGKLGKNDLKWGVFNKSFKTEQLDANGLAQAIQSGYSVAPVFRGKRDTKNFISTQIIGLDFDDSSLDDVRQLSLVADYAAILHTTSSHKPDAPRSRVIFILDQPIYCPDTYIDYVRALLWRCQLADRQCSDAARLWFGAAGCNIEIDASKVFPLSVIESITAEYRSSIAVAPGLPEQPTKDDSNKGAVDVLDWARRVAVAGNRNVTGFELCRRLRDLGVPKHEAIGILQNYQIAVEGLGDHAYSFDEAYKSLCSAYSHQAQGKHDPNFQATLIAFEFAVMSSDLLPAKSRHYMLKTAMGISQIAEKAKRTVDLFLPVRDFSEFGVSKSGASGHLQKFVEIGLLKLESPADERKAARYTITVSPQIDKPAQADQSFDITLTAEYKRLQGLPHFEYGAKIDPNMTTVNLSDGTLGPTALRLIAVLSIEIWTKAGHTRELNATAVCPTFTPILSMADLWTIAQVSKSAGQSSFKTLIELGICTYEYAANNNKTKLPALTENWHERLQEIAPLLTTYGKKEKRNHQTAKQRALHHSAIAEFERMRPEDKEKSKALAEKAKRKVAQTKEALDTINQTKQSRLPSCR